jgi:hypothetical protein
MWNAGRPERVGLGIAERIMKGRLFHYRPRSRGIPTGPIAHADDEDDEIETWMIGQGLETRGNRSTLPRTVWKFC